MLLCAAAQGSEVGTVTRKIGIETRTLVGNYPAIKTQSLHDLLANALRKYATKGSAVSGTR